MPELPEIETIVRSLQPLVGTKIKQLNIINDVIVKKQDFSVRELDGKVIKSIERRGKFIIMYAEDGLALVVHLGMSGRFYLEDPLVSHPKHTHAVLMVDDGRELRYHDPRRFGGIWLTWEPHRVVEGLGPEPLGTELTSAYLCNKCAKRTVAIKTLILNQGIIAGIGNIYADEILHRAGILPSRPSGSLNRQEIENLQAAMVEILEMGIANRGTTFRDYRDGMNMPGNFQNHLRVYGRAGLPCPVCGNVILREVIGGRGSHFCTHCQS